ncbi:response regulator, partial [Acinetobacter baumannii]|nr:response regulator [Acinetobacter baumannii]
QQGSIFKVKLFLPSKSLIHPITDVASNTVVGYTGQRHKILVVDNEVTDRGLVLDFLQPLGFILEEAESGLQCLRQVPVFNPDLILMDLSMPVLGGWETAKLLRKNKLTNVPIIIISADANERMQNPETDVLNEDFLVKPVDLNLLLNKIGDKLGLKWIHQHQTDEQPEIYIPIQNSAGEIADPIQIIPSFVTHLNLQDTLTQLEQHLSIGYIRGAKQQLAQCRQHFDQYQD